MKSIPTRVLVVQVVEDLVAVAIVVAAEAVVTDHDHVARSNSDRVAATVQVAAVDKAAQADLQKVVQAKGVQRLKDNARVAAIVQAAADMVVGKAAVLVRLKAVAHHVSVASLDKVRNSHPIFTIGCGA